MKYVEEPTPNYDDFTLTALPVPLLDQTAIVGIKFIK